MTTVAEKKKITLFRDERFLRVAVSEWLVVFILQTETEIIYAEV